MAMLPGLLIQPPTPISLSSKEPEGPHCALAFPHLTVSPLPQDKAQLLALACQAQCGPTSLPGGRVQLP